MSDSELPDSEFTPLNENAVHLHELYLGWIEAGFPEDRAFELVTTTWLHYLET
jgi:hypothetical protein